MGAVGAGRTADAMAAGSDAGTQRVVHAWGRGSAEVGACEVRVRGGVRGRGHDAHRLEARVSWLMRRFLELRLIDTYHDHCIVAVL